MKNSHGGKRQGSGRKELSPNIKKKLVSIRLPPWLLAKMDKQPESRAVLIEQSLCKVHGWKAPKGKGVKS